MLNEIQVSGWQLMLDVGSDINIINAYGGRAEEANHLISFSEDGIVLGFSLDLTLIEPGEGVLVYIEVEYDTDNIGFVAPVDHIYDDGTGNILTVFVDANGSEISYEWVVTYWEMGSNTLITTDVTFNVYRDDMLIASDIDNTSYIDSNPSPGTTHCYIVKGYDGAYESNPSNESCSSIDPLAEPTYFVSQLDQTGENQLVIIENLIGDDIEENDEIGIFDMSGVVESCNPDEGCDSPLYGEVLVGSGVWSGEQLEISCILSVDLSDFNGPVLNGAVGGNNIIFKFWDSSENIELTVNPDFTTGSGQWGDIFTSVILEPIYTIQQQVNLNAFVLNSVSLNVGIDLSISQLLGDIPLVMSDDNGDFYVPSFGVDQLGNFSNEGYKCFVSGSDAVTISVEGLPVDQTTGLTIEAFKLNMLPYLPQYEMSSDDVFGDYYDDILLVSNDMGQFNVPSFGVYQITTMSPGEAYSVFLNGANDVDFSYPGMGMARGTDMSYYDGLYEASLSENYDVAQTGIYHPIVITSISGMVESGDEIVAYANGEVVGATKVVDPNGVTLISASGGYNQYGLELPGYMEGDEIELRLYRQSTGEELYVTSNLEGSYYGMTPLTSGGITVHEVTAVPEDYVLSQNYPNPFNPSTQIEYSVPESGYVTVAIYDVAGRLVQTLVDGVVESGYHSIVWDGRDSAGHTVSAGLYIYSLKGDHVAITRKMVMMK